MDSMDTASLQQVFEDNQITSVRLVSPACDGRSRTTPVSAGSFLRALGGAGEGPPADVVALVRSADRTTLGIVPWEERVATCVCDLCPLQEDASAPSPRVVLRSILSRYRDAGYAPVGSASFVISCCPDGTPPGETVRLALPTLHHDISDAQLMERLVDLMGSYGVRISGYQRAQEPGCFEVTLARAELLDVADQGALFGVGVSDIFRQLCLPSPFPLAGRASGRVYLSLLDGERNLLRRGLHDDAPGPLLRSFLAGIAEVLPDLLALFTLPLPAVGRVVGAPTHFSASVDETPATGSGAPGISLFHPEARSSSVEIRLPVVGPHLYLAFAALLAGGLYGIEHQLKAPSHLDAEDFAAFLLADEQQDLALPPLPASFPASLDRWRHSQRVSDYLGVDVIDTVHSSLQGARTVA